MIWEDGALLFSDILPDFPWTTRDSLRVGRIAPELTARLPSALEETGLWQHPAYSGCELEGTVWTASWRPRERAEQRALWVCFEMVAHLEPAFQPGSSASLGPHFQAYAHLDARHVPETVATLFALWGDVRSLLRTLRPLRSVPLSEVAVRRPSGAISFRGLTWEH